MALSWLLKIAILGPREIVATSTWPSMIAIPGPERRGNDHTRSLQTHHDHDLAIKDCHTWSWWCGNGLELTFNSCHTWPPRNHRDHDLAIKDCHTWSQMTWQWPRFSLLQSLYLVPPTTTNARPRDNRQRPLHLVVKKLVACGTETTIESRDPWLVGSTLFWVLTLPQLFHLNLSSHELCKSVSRDR